MPYEPTIGLEIHVELKTQTKMFCSCANDPNEKHPNTNICPVCMGHPGTLPVPNDEAIKKLIKVGLALHCQIAHYSKFDRKNYFYPDLPKGYQISQYDLPLCHDGWLEVKSDKGETKKIRIERIHLEEDTGRLQHAPDKTASLVDYNRAGVPLMELVTKPDITESWQIYEFAKELQLILRYLEASDGDMEKGQMRVEVNISIHKPGEEYGTKVEIKNINSISFAVKAADYELKRQIEALETGEEIVQETRGWDDINSRTFSQRIKEGSADYRYFPEPDIPPFRFTQEQIDLWQAELPELPEARRQRLQDLYGLTDAQSAVFTIAKHLGDYFENTASELLSWDKFEHLKKPADEHKQKLYTLAANYIITEFPPLLNARGLEIDDLVGFTIKPSGLAEVIVRIFHNELSSTNAKIVLKEMAETGESPEQIIKEHDLAQVSDTSELIEAVDHVIDENPKPISEYKAGKTEVLKFLVGKAMAKTKGKANPSVISQMLEEKLKL